MSFDFENQNIRKNMYDGHFGLEKEGLRINPTGFLAHTKHPFPNHPNIDRDFCENQVEIITDVHDSIEGLWEQLSGLHTQVVKTLYNHSGGREFLWPFSNPPYVRGEKDVPIARFDGKLKGKERYREYLAGKYGRKKMLFSGIHFNFSFSDDLLEAGYRSSDFKSFKSYKNSIYWELAKKMACYSWLIVYLTAASPVMDGSYFMDEALGKDVLKNYASVRCSEIGYWNDFIPVLSYENIEDYVESIQAYINDGQLRSAAELYYPVRLKSSGENSLENLVENGVDHIELRTLDLNPLSPVGIFKEDLQFIHLLMIYLMSLDDMAFEAAEQTMAIKNVKRAARYEVRDIWIETGWNTSFDVRDAALKVLSGMERFYKDFAKSDWMQVIYNHRQRIAFKEFRYAEKIRERFQKDYVKNGLKLAKQYAERWTEL